MKTFFSGLVASVVIALCVGSSAVLAAETTSTSGGLNTTAITNLSKSIIELLNTVVVPLVFALAFIVFIWGVFQAFIVNGANEEKRREGTQFILWAVIGFAVMISIWGLVNIAVSIIPTENNARPDFPCFDKDPAKCNS